MQYQFLIYNFMNRKYIIKKIYKKYHQEWDG